MHALVKNSKLEVVEKVKLNKDQKNTAIQIRNICKAYEAKACNTGQVFYVDVPSKLK